MKCTTVLHGGVYRQTSTPHKSGNKMKRKKKMTGVWTHPCFGTLCCVGEVADGLVEIVVHVVHVEFVALTQLLQVAAADNILIMLGNILFMAQTIKMIVKIKPTLKQNFETNYNISTRLLWALIMHWPLHDKDP